LLQHQFSVNCIRRASTTEQHILSSNRATKVNVSHDIIRPYDYQTTWIKTLSV